MEDLQGRGSMQLPDQVNEGSTEMELDIEKKRAMDKMMLECFERPLRRPAQGEGIEERAVGCMSHASPSSSINPAESSYAFASSTLVNGAPAPHGCTTYPHHSVVANSTIGRLLSNDISASHRYIPCQHHPVVTNSFTASGESVMHRQAITRRLNTPPSVPMEFPLFGIVHFPDGQTRWSPFRLLPSQRVPNSLGGEVAVGTHESSVSSVLTDGAPASNRYVPCHHHQVIAISDTHPGESVMHRPQNAQGLSTPQSVTEWVQLPIGQAAFLQAQPTRNPNGHILRHSGGEARLGTSQLFPSQRTPNANNNSGQASSTDSRSQVINRTNSAKCQLPKQASLEPNTRPPERSPRIAHRSGYLGKMDMHKIRDILFAFQHSLNCSPRGRECKDPHCQKGKRLLEHMSLCESISCRCHQTKQWIGHFRECHGRCDLCGPVWAASHKHSYGSGVENVGIITKMAPSTSSTKPPSKCYKMDNSIQVSRTTSKTLSTATELIVLDDEPCVDPSKESTEKYGENVNPRVVAIEERASVEPIVQERIYVQREQEAEKKLYSSITLPSAAHVSNGASSSYPFTQEQVNDKNLRLKRCRDERKAKANIDVGITTARVPSIPNTDTLKDLKPPTNCCKMDGAIQVGRFMSKSLSTGIELINLDEAPCGGLSKESTAKSRDTVSSGAVAIEEGAGVEPIIQEGISVQCEQEEEKKLVSNPTLPSAAHVSNGASFSNPVTPEQVMEKKLRLERYDDQSKAKADINRRMEGSTDENLISLCGTDKLSVWTPCNEELIQEGISLQCEQQVETQVPTEAHKVLTEMDLDSIVSSDGHLNQTVLRKLNRDRDHKLSPNQCNDQSKAKADLNHGVAEIGEHILSPKQCGDQGKVKDDINQGMEGSLYENPSNLCCMNKIYHETARNEEFIEERISVQFEQQVEFQVQTEADKVEMEVDSDVASPSAAHLNQAMQRINGASFVYSFTSEQVREHILSLKQCGDQCKVNEDVDQGMEGLVDESHCSLCGLGELSFEPPPKFCLKCCVLIRNDGEYYSERNFNSTKYGGDAHNSYCKKCRKSMSNDLEKRINSGTNEPWVQCDKCKAWQHQICALFNNKKNESDQAEYTCPKCYLREIASGDHESLPQNATFEAKHLPKTKLSDHIEQWLSRRLREDRQKRADNLGKNIDEVPGAEDLVVRVVSSVNKEVKVKKSFHKMFQTDNYPKKFPYKSKAILLFQKIGGADVCLFAAYAQEYGPECPYPNQRRVYLSYIDSVKYFRPRIQAATEEALRTYVYHEILIGYLDYCKKRGFNSCHLWASPPLRKNDYILYSHPKEQKTPTSNVLRKWYHDIIYKAEKENIVVGKTNLYDQFFESHGECKAEITATHLPYFNGDFWPRKAIDLLKKEDGSTMTKKEKKVVPKRASRVNRHDISLNPKAILLNNKLGDSIRRRKQDFIVIHLQHACKCCCQYILPRRRWMCSSCKEFQLCEKCHETEESIDIKDRHLGEHKEKDTFHMVEVDEVPADIIQEDETISNKIFDMRTRFLRFCRDNHYQFDTLRRAKHSTMMIVHDLLNTNLDGIKGTSGAS